VKFSLAEEIAIAYHCPSYCRYLSALKRKKIGPQKR